MIAFVMIVSQILRDRVSKRGLPEEHHPSQTLFLDGAHKPLRERFVRSMKSECLNRMIFFGRTSLQFAIGHYMAHCHTERNHQGLANQLPRAAPTIAPSQPVLRRQRLGGMLNYYHRAAA